jgi:hypothetical protein
MATALSGHASDGCKHAQAEPWVWHPIAQIKTRRKLRRVLFDFYGEAN